MEFIRLGLGERRCNYEQTWQLQQRLHAEVVAGSRGDTVLLLEHDDVITAGRRTNRADRPADGTNVIDVDRGGKLTWHGPGQLVVYPILRLAQPVDVIAYVRALEEAVIRLAHAHLLATTRIEGHRGVWVPGVPNRKLAAIGVRVAKGVTMHGIAINVRPDLQKFSSFVPCGIADAAVTSLNYETGTDATLVQIADELTDYLHQTLSPLRAQARAH